MLLTATFKPKADVERTLPGLVLLTDAVEKGIWGLFRVTLIQAKGQTRNIDSRNSLF
jgi:hypothetical protein